MLLDVNDERLATREDVFPGFRRHIGDDDEGLLTGKGFDLFNDIVGFGVVCPFGSCEQGESFAPGGGLESGVWFP